MNWRQLVAPWLWVGVQLELAQVMALRLGQWPQNTLSSFFTEALPNSLVLFRSTCDALVALLLRPSPAAQEKERLHCLS